MKWETLKDRVTAVALQDATMLPYYALQDAHAERRDWWTSHDELQLLIRKRIAAWDVRLVGKLRELFPQAFPRALRTKNLVAYLNDNSDWIIE